MSRTTITSVRAQEVYTDRGHPGVEAIVRTECGAQGRAVCTSGISIGSHEVAFSFDDSARFFGKGVRGAVENVNKIIGPAIMGMNAAGQLDIDTRLLAIVPDAKHKLGGNAIAAVSAAVLKAGAAALDIPLYQHIGGSGAMTLPVPGILVAGGSQRYGGGITNGGGKPSYSIMLYGFGSFSEASYAGWELQQKWVEMMAKRMPDPHPNEKGQITIPAGVFRSDEELWALMNETIIKGGYEGKCGLQLDVATDTYHNKKDNLYYGIFSDVPKTVDDLFKTYEKMVNEYNFVVIEDPFNEDDYDNTARLTKATGIQIVGDDLFTTNPERVKVGIQRGAANTVLLKVNQVGTISESLEMVALAYHNGYGVMPNSSRGEGNDIADYSVGINAATIRERACYPVGNRFLEIERELGPRARFLGIDAFKGWRFRKATQG
jgi:enolase